MCLVSKESRAPHLCECVCDTMLVLISMVTVIQDGLWKHASCRPRCVLSLLPCMCPIQLWGVGGRGAEKDLDDNAELVGEKMGIKISTMESGAQGNKRWVGDGEWLEDREWIEDCWRASHERHLTLQRRHTNETTAETQIDAERYRNTKWIKRQLVYDTKERMRPGLELLKQYCINF